ncbi:MAG: metallophosphoesterase, partial [Bacteroidota bacterium]
MIKDTEGVSRQMSFKTLPDNPYERLSIVAGGDSRNHRRARQKANLLVAKLRPHAVMFGGDMTGGDVAKQWTAWMDDWQRTITTDGQLIPIIPARGNHEKSNQSLIDLFDVKNEKIYYALNLGGSLLRVYTLNSMIAAGGDQKAWLENDLTRNGHIKWKMAQYHHAIRPHNSKKSERNVQLKNWANLFYKHGVDLVCESDSHVAKTTYPIRPSRAVGSDEGFIRDDVNGTVYIGEGCWGAPLRRNNDDKSWTRASGSFNQFKWIFVDLDGIEIRTIKVDNAEQVEALTIDDIFATPARLDVWNPSTGSVIRIGSSPMYASIDDSGFDSSYSSPPPTASSKPKRLPTPAIPAMEDMVKIEEPTTYLQNSGGTATKKLMDIKPIEVHNFVVEETAGEIVVKWSTKNEYLKPVFELQRSLDGKDYEICARIQGTGTFLPEIQNNYKYRDRIKQSSATKIPYYRLQCTLENGESKMFQAKVISTDNEQWNDLAKLVSNPQTG